MTNDKLETMVNDLYAFLESEEFKSSLTQKQLDFLNDVQNELGRAQYEPNDMVWTNG